MENLSEKYLPKNTEQKKNTLLELKKSSGNLYRELVFDMQDFVQSERNKGELYEKSFTKSDLCKILRDLGEEVPGEKEIQVGVREDIEQTLAA